MDPIAGFGITRRKRRNSTRDEFLPYLVSSV